MPTLKVSQLNERAEALSGVDIFELIERVRVSSVEYGKLKAKVDHLEHYRKSKLAIIVEQLKRGYIDNNKKIPGHNFLENEARASSDYIDFLQTQYHVNQEANIKGAEHFALRNSLEAAQEMLKTVRAEMYHNQNA